MRVGAQVAATGCPRLPTRGCEVRAHSVATVQWASLVHAVSPTGSVRPSLPTAAGLYENVIPRTTPYSCPSHSRVGSMFAVVLTAKWAPFASNLRFSLQNTGKRGNYQLTSGQLTGI